MELIVAGAGWAGEAHVRAIQCLHAQGADCGVAALVDPDREHLSAKAAEWGIARTYADLPSALSECADAAAVVLATPHHLHRRGAELAAGAGRHVLVEKPMALRLGDADAMIAACERAGVRLMVAESARYERSALAMREVLSAGTIGRVLSARINRITRGRHSYAYPGRRAWLADPAVCGGGIWMLNGIHDMSLARMLLGEPVRIYAREVHSERFASPLEATVVALVSFDGGTEATFTVSAELHGYKRFGDVVLFGTDGTLRLARDSGELNIYTEDGEEALDCRQEQIDQARGAFVRQMREFLTAVAEGGEPPTSGRSERRSLRAILAGYESIRTGRPVDVQARPDRAS